MIYTIGYGSQKSPRLPALKLEQLAEVRARLKALIVDVRARPSSRWRPEVCERALARRFGTNYLSMSDALGNQTKALPGIVSKRGLHWLESREASRGNLLLLCLEKHPRDCHRHHAIAMQLPFGSVCHLYHDGYQWLEIEAHKLQCAIDADFRRGREPFSVWDARATR